MTAQPVQESTIVGIVGAGPAGLMLSHLLSQSGIDSIAVDTRTRHEIEHTHRAGILEQDSVRLLTDTGVDGRVLTDGSEHEGIRCLWRRLGVTVLFVTHDIDESVYLGQRVIVLSSSPTVVMADVAIDLPDDRGQLTTRSAPRFAELRSEIYELIQQAKRGHRPAAATVSRIES